MLIVLSDQHNGLASQMDTVNVDNIVNFIDDWRKSPILPQGKGLPLESSATAWEVFESFAR